ncbi:MAG TPA: L-lactate permease, partial [Adhaeribacter sp.]|nr:L-lactate permease [Adhaeribacter sp.]
MNSLDILLAFLPVALLIVLPLLTNVRLAALVALAVTSGLYFWWQAPVPFYFASLAASVISTLNILMIVFGAVFLFEIMQASGYIGRINASLAGIHPAREVRFFLVAIGLTGFFEGVAGFGTPGAIVPLLLISMGFRPLFSVVSVLLLDGFFAAFGAVGTPLLAGLALPLNLTDAVTAAIAINAAWMLAAAALPVLGFIAWQYQQQENQIGQKGTVLVLFAAAIIPFVGFAYLVPEFTTILASVSMLVISVLIVTGGKPRLDLKPWLPYAGLVVLLLLPKLIAPLGRVLDLELRWEPIFATTVAAALKPLRSPLIPFVVVALVFGGSRSHYGPSLKSAGKKVLAVALVLFPVIAVAQLMLTSGVNRPSMIAVIAEAFSYAGQGYVALAPFIG